MTAAAMIERERPGRATLVGGWILPALIAALPVIFALTTWNPALDNDALAKAVAFGAPVAAAEAAVILWAMTRGFTLRDVLPSLERWQRWVLASLVLIAFYGAVFVAPDRGTALARTCLSVLHVLFGFAAAFLLARSDMASRRLLWPAVAIGMCGYCVLVPIYLASIPDRATFDWVRLGLAVIHVRQVGFYAAIGCSAALGAAFFAERGRSRLGWTAVAAIGFALSGWSGTRGSIVAVPAAVLIVAVLVPAIRRAHVLTTTVASIVAGLAASLAFTPPDAAYGLWRISSSLTPGQDLSTGRLTMWLGTLRGIMHRPLFGHGESQFRLLVPEAIGTYNHPHNLVLQLAFQWGVIGLLCVVALALPIGRRAIGAARAAPAQAVPALLVLTCLLVFSMYEGTGYHVYPVMMIATSIAFLLTITPSGADRGAARPIVA